MTEAFPIIIGYTSYNILEEIKGRGVVGGRDVWKWMRLDPKKQSRERAENKVIYNLLSVTKGNQITTHYSRQPRKKKSHGLEKRGNDAFLSRENFFPRPTSIVFKWSTKPKPSLKIRTASAIFLIYLSIFRDYDLIFLGNNFFLFFKIESWNF